MRAAGVRPDDPVLLVGHSQGALDAVRLAQRGGFDVRGVVTLGGPTGQLVLPDDVPELSVEHEEDPVPSLAGLPATGAAGLHRLVVRRSLYGGGAPPGPPVLPFGAGAQPHALTAYRETLALADESPDPRLRAFKDDIRPFLAARDGRIVLVRSGPADQSSATPLSGRSTSPIPQLSTREHERTEHAPPEAADDEAEADQRADPRHEQEQQAVHEQGDQPEGEQVQRERDDADRLPQHAVDDAEEQTEQQVGEHHRDRVRRVRRDVQGGRGAGGREHEGLEPQRDRVADDAHDEAAHGPTMAGLGRTRPVRARRILDP